MELSGFFTSCATPAVTRPSAAKALGNLELAADALNRFHVAQGDECSHACAVLANHLHADADALRAISSFKRHFLALGGFDLLAFEFARRRATDAAPEKFRLRAGPAAPPADGPEIFQPKG